MALNVLVCGDREWADKDRIRRALKKLPKTAVIIEGGQTGADTLAREVAEELGLKWIEVQANWKLYGPRAGPKRNKEMLDMGVHLVIAFHNNIKISRGTKNCVKQARQRGIPVEVLTS